MPLISPKMNAAINEQVGNEFGASLQYVAIAAYFDGESLPELAANFYRQSSEERAHAMKMVRYLLDTGGAVEIPALDAPQSRFGSAREAVQRALEGEAIVTRQINALVNLAIQENDHITQAFLQWFVTEQLEEMSGAETLLKIVQRAGEGGLLSVEDYLVRHRAQARSVTTGAEDG